MHVRDREVGRVVMVLLWFVCLWGIVDVDAMMLMGDSRKVILIPIQVPSFFSWYFEDV